MAYRAETPRTPWTRNKQITTKFNVGELADLSVIADHWDVSVGTAIWAVIAEWLAILRKRDLTALPYPNSSKAIIMRAHELERLHEESSQGSEDLDGPLDADVCPVCGHVTGNAVHDGEGRHHDDEGGEDPRHGDEPGRVSSGHLPRPQASAKAPGEIR